MQKIHDEYQSVIPLDLPEQGYETLFAWRLSALWTEDELMKALIKDITVSYIIGFPIAVTLIFAWMVLKSNGVFTVDMTLYNEFYFEAFLFVLWISLFATNGISLINKQLKRYVINSLVACRNYHHHQQ